MALAHCFGQYVRMRLVLNNNRVARTGVVAMQASCSRAHFCYDTICKALDGVFS